MAETNLVLEFAPESASLTQRNAPILSGIEVIAENLGQDRPAP